MAIDEKKIKDAIESTCSRWSCEVTDFAFEMNGDVADCDVTMKIPSVSSAFDDVTFMMKIEQGSVDIKYKTTDNYEYLNPYARYESELEYQESEDELGEVMVYLQNNILSNISGD